MPDEESQKTPTTIRIVSTKSSFGCVGLIFLIWLIVLSVQLSNAREDIDAINARIS